MNYGQSQVKLRLNDAIALSRRGDYVYHPAGYYLQNGRIMRMDNGPVNQLELDKLYKHLRSNWILEIE